MLLPAPQALSRRQYHRRLRALELGRGGHSERTLRQDGIDDKGAVVGGANMKQHDKDYRRAVAIDDDTIQHDR